MSCKVGLGGVGYGFWFGLSGLRGKQLSARAEKHPKFRDIKAAELFTHCTLSEGG